MSAYLAGLCAVAALLAAGGRLRRSRIVVTVTGPSMTPSFLPGDRVMIARRPAGRLSAGTVVVLHEPDPREPIPHEQWPGPAAAAGRAGRANWVIKRVAALPGDPVPHAVRQAVGGTAVVPPRMIVVLGDNSARSGDSRQWGFVPADQILGVVIRRIG